MEAVREAWTDSRLDDLNERVGDMGRRMDEGFSRIHEDLRALRSEMDAKIDSKVDSLRSELHTEIGSVREELRAEIGSARDELRAEIGALHRLVLQVGGSMVVTFAVAFAGLIATQL